MLRKVAEYGDRADTGVGRQLPHPGGWSLSRILVNEL